MCWKAETLLCRVPYSHGYGLHGGDIWLWELGCKEGRITKNWCFQTGVLEKTPEIPWTARRPNQSILKEINHVFSGRTDAEAPVLLSPDVKSWLFGIDPDAWTDWRQRSSEAEMVGWHHQLNGVWTNSRKWWRTGRPGVLQSMGSQRVGPDWVTKQQKQWRLSFIFFNMWSNSLSLLSFWRFK